MGQKRSRKDDFCVVIVKVHVNGSILLMRQTIPCSVIRVSILYCLRDSGVTSRGRGTVVPWGAGGESAQNGLTKNLTNTKDSIIIITSHRGNRYSGLDSPLYLRNELYDKNFKITKLLL